MSSDKPFTETLELDDVGLVVRPVHHHEYANILVIDSKDTIIALHSDTARALYEYLKRHFKQSDRYRLKRFAACYGQLIRQRCGIDEIISEFLKSEEGK